jgi:hypothetical protein
MSLLRLVLLILIVVLGVSLIPNLAERNWGEVLLSLALIVASVLGYRALRRRRS